MCHKEPFRRLDCFLLAVISAVAVFVFVAIYILVYKSSVSLIKENSALFADAVAKQTFSDMYQLMRRGWTRQELVEFLEGIKKAHADVQVEVNIYRGEKVRELFGPIEEPPRNRFVEEAFKRGRIISEDRNNVLYHVYPLRAKAECLRCHVNAKEGDVLGAIEIKQDITRIMSNLKKELFLIALYIIPIPLIGAGIVLLTFNRRVERSLKKLNESIDHLQSVSDLKTIQVEEIDFGFEELNRIGGSISRLADKLRNIAVDKDILEFELSLLERSVLTSEAVTDWRDFFKTILTEVSKILDYIYFMVVSKEENETFRVHMFWNCTCYEKEGFRKEMEEEIVSMLKEIKFCSLRAEIEFDHIPLGEMKKLDSCDLSYVRLQTKRLFLKKPAIDILVGMGLSEREISREAKEHAVEALLTTLLNTLGSIKAVSKYTEKLEYFAARDPLTGLYNQRIFWELFDYEIERAKRHNYKFSLFIIDLDNFKLINDIYGHNFGDQVLKEIGRILEKIFRKEDIIARYGGDEFAVILPYTGPEQAESIAKRLVKAFEEFSIEAPNGKIIKVTSSIGVAVFPDHGQDSRELFILADSMLYRAKEAGKNRYVLPREEDLAAAEHELVNKSFFILERSGEINIVPFFQPILNLKTGKTEGYEVLMRIEQEGKILPASDFIYTAERTASIHRLDASLMECAFEKVKEKDCEPLLFFNLSPKVLIVEEFLTNIKEIIHSFGVGYDRIVFEITERETVRSFEILRKFGTELKKLGFRLAVDDFGSGFASFTYIKLLPIDFVKIDGDFIRSMVKSEVDKAFVDSTVLMMKTLNIKTVAEFVESREILEKVLDMDIDYAQGFYIGEPSPEVCEGNNPTLDSIKGRTTSG